MTAVVLLGATHGRDVIAAFTTSGHAVSVVDETGVLGTAVMSEAESPSCSAAACPVDPASYGANVSGNNTFALVPTGGSLLLVGTAPDGQHAAFDVVNGGVVHLSATVLPNIEQAVDRLATSSRN